MNARRKDTFDLVAAVQRSLVAQEVSEVRRSTLPWPWDDAAERTVLAALARGSWRDVRPAWFFLPIHEAIARAALSCAPNDERALLAALGGEVRLKSSAEEVLDMIEALFASEYTVDEIARAVERCIELHEARKLIAELEATARALRVEGLTTEQVRRRLRKLGEGER